MSLTFKELKEEMVDANIHSYISNFESLNYDELNVIFKIYLAGMNLEHLEDLSRLIIESELESCAEYICNIINFAELWNSRMK